MVYRLHYEGLKRLNPGFYVEEERLLGWLRLFLGIHDSNVVYVDLTWAIDKAASTRWPDRRRRVLAKDRAFDAVIVDSLRRKSRDLDDSAGIYKRLDQRQVEHEPRVHQAFGQ